MTLLKDNNYKDINVALLSLEADIKNKITGSFDTSEIDKQLAEINSRIDKINTNGGSSSSDEIEDINSKLNSNSIKIRNIEQNVEDIGTQIDGIEQKLSEIFSAESKVTDFNTTTASGIYYWVIDAANRPTDYGVLLVNKYYNGGDITTGLWINQIAYGTNNKIYFRQNINSGNWTEWKAVAFEGEMNADTVDNYHASQLWRSDGAIWNPNANVVMTPSGNGSEWSFDFRDKNGATGTYWQVWDENKQTLLQVDADSGKVSAPYGFVGNLSGKADTAGSAGTADSLFYRHGNEINFKGGAQTQCWFNYRNADTEGPSPVDTMEYRFCNYSGDTSKSVLMAGSFNGTTAKVSSKMVIPIGAPSSLEDGCIWIER